MDPTFHLQDRVLTVGIPATGIEPALLAHSPERFGIAAGSAVDVLRIESPPQWRWCSLDAAFLAQLVRRLERPGQRIAIEGVPADMGELLALAHQPSSLPPSTPPLRPGFIMRVGLSAQACAASTKQFVDLLGEVILLLPRFVAGRAKVRGAEVLEVMAESSTRALFIVGLVNLLMGAILAFVGAIQLRAFGVGIFVADLVGIAVVRELSPILTAVVLAGRTGASFAARIATMRGNEEIDALTTLGLSPVEFLVLPRVAALSLALPLLYVYAFILSLLGGMLVAVPLLDISTTAYIVQTRHAIAGANFAIGALKALIFGAAVALIGCHYGLRAARSAAGVGEATTMAVVSSIVVIIVLDAVFAICANALGL
ncbi:MAG: ABC transporter permease [Burkholderiales bacterium]|nr:ABC transporter permease [Burkholderiales bacterium]